MRLSTQYLVVLTTRQHQTIVYTVGIRPTFMRFETAQKVVLLAQDAHDTGEWTERELTPALLRFQRRLRNWLAWRAAMRRCLTPRRLLQREVGGLLPPQRLDLLLDEGYHQERDMRQRHLMRLVPS
jgi:hypothetical protein